MADPRGAGLTEEELARIEAEHVHSDYTGVFGLDTNGVCAKCDSPWPCDAARLCALVLRQSALLAAWGLPCSCDPDFDLPDAP